MLIGGAAVLGVLGYVAWKRERYRVGIAVCELAELYRAYAHYVSDHDGALPDRFSDLSEGGYLRRAGKADAYSFFGPGVRDEEIIPVYPGLRIGDVRDYEITYGGNLKDFELQSGQVLRIRTKEEVLFIKPSSAYLLELSQDYSRRLLRKPRIPK